MSRAKLIVKVTSLFLLAAAIANSAIAAETANPFEEAFPDNYYSTGGQGAAGVAEGAVGISVNLSGGMERWVNQNYVKAESARMINLAQTQAESALSSNNPEAKEFFAKRNQLIADVDQWKKMPVEMLQRRENMDRLTEIQAQLKSHENSELGKRMMPKLENELKTALQAKDLSNSVSKEISEIRQKLLSHKITVTAKIGGGIFLISEGVARIGLSVSGRDPGFSPALNTSRALVKSIAPRAAEPEKPAAQTSMDHQ
jgi:hypothetical protein